MSANANILYYGSDSPLPEQFTVNAGALSLTFTDGEIRCIRLGGREIVRRIYVAVRDRNWQRVPASLLEIDKNIAADSFDLRFAVEHKQSEIDFVWTGSISGTSQGTIVFKMEGAARSTFMRNRIGFCVLHSAREFAGTSCVVEKTNGGLVEGIFPRRVSPHQVFSEMRAISYEVLPGVQAKVSFHGETYEMEDQRNWGDASYKIYCTPLSLPFPVEIPAGTMISQSITLEINGSLSALHDHHRDERIVVELGASSFPLPRIGHCFAAKPLSELSTQRLRAIHMSHLRVDLRLAHEYKSALQNAADHAKALNVPLEAAIFVSDNAQHEVRDLRAALDVIRPQIATWIIFHESEKVTGAKWIEAARNGLSNYAPSAKFGGGTDANFAELNRSSIPYELLDFANYPLNPQVHASDHQSLIENLEAQLPMAESAREFTRGLPLAVSPITLKPRFDLGATTFSAIDPLQASLLGAGWTLGSLSALANAGVQSATYFETVGCAGLMAEGESPRQNPRVYANSVFPLYHIFADLGEYRNAKSVACESSAPLEIQAIALSKNGKLRIIVANLTSNTKRVTLTKIHSAAFEIKLLDETNVEWAMKSAEEYRSAAGKLIKIAEGGTEITLLPMGIARLYQQ